MSSLSVGVIFCPCLEYDYVLTSRLSGPGAQVRYLTRVLTGPENRRRERERDGNLEDLGWQSTHMHARSLCHLDPGTFPGAKGEGYLPNT